MHKVINSKNNGETNHNISMNRLQGERKRQLDIGSGSKRERERESGGKRGRAGQQLMTLICGIAFTLAAAAAVAVAMLVAFSLLWAARGRGKSQILPRLIMFSAKSKPAQLSFTAVIESHIIEHRT